MIMEELVEKGLLNAPEELAELNDSIDQIELQIGRCSDITHSILKFGRKSEVARPRRGFETVHSRRHRHGRQQGQRGRRGNPGERIGEHARRSTATPASCNRCF